MGFRVQGLGLTWGKNAMGFRVMLWGVQVKLYYPGKEFICKKNQEIVDWKSRWGKRRFGKCKKSQN